MVRQDECAEERIEAEAGIVEEMEEKERKKERERNRKRELEGPKVEWINCSQSLTQSVSQKKERDRQRHRLSVFNKKMKDNEAAQLPKNVSPLSKVLLSTWRYFLCSIPFIN